MKRSLLNSELRWSGTGTMFHSTCENTCRLIWLLVLGIRFCLFLMTLKVFDLQKVPWKRTKKTAFIWFVYSSFISYLKFRKHYFQRNWVFATNLNVLILISMQPYGVNLCYFKLILFYLTEFIVWNIKGLWHWVAKI